MYYVLYFIIRFKQNIKLWLWELEILINYSIETSFDVT